VPQFIDKPGIGQTRTNARAAHELNVLAGLLFEHSDFIHSDV
jgi:hypothetical protein